MAMKALTLNIYCSLVILDDVKFTQVNFKRAALSVLSFGLQTEIKQYFYNSKYVLKKGGR
jgi:hypothetical protein